MKKKKLSQQARGVWTIYLLLVLVFIVMCICSESFRSLYNITNMLTQCVPLACVAMGQTLVIISGGIDLIFNTPEGTGDSGASTREDGYHIRTAAVLADVPLVTTVPGLGAATQGIEALQRGEIEVRSLQDWAAR